MITEHKQVNFTRRLGRHLDFRLRGMGYFGSRVNYHHNSTSSFQLIRLIKCGDVSLNPRPTAIQVVIGNRHLTNGDFANAAGSRVPPCLRSNLDNIIVANRHLVLESIKNDMEQLLLCVLNARSLRNKAAAFVDLVCDSKADLFAVSETWLTDNDTAILSDLTPQGYKLHHCPRSDRRGGGTALIFKESINVEKVSVAGKGSFEASEWSINPAATTRLRVVIVYRHPYSVKHPVTTSTFITEFSDYLESLVMSSEPLLILGRLPADLVAFKKERNRVVNLMNEARRDYYNQFIEDNSTDQRRLFMASKSLLNMQLDRSLPPHTDVSLLANDMGEFFITKIGNIRLKLDCISPSHLLSTPEPELVSEFSDNVLSHFQCQTVEAVRDMITSGKKNLASCNHGQKGLRIFYSDEQIRTTTTFAHQTQPHPPPPESMLVNAHTTMIWCSNNIGLGGEGGLKWKLSTYFDTGCYKV